MEQSGKIYLVATPIGNLGDMSPRAIETLRAADLIAAEDTRNTIKLLNHFEIKTHMTSYHEYNRTEKAYELVRRAEQGETIAVVSDAGMPAISDPGEVLVRMALDAGIEVTIVPGPCAAVSALAISGQTTGRFVFEAFLPQEKKERRARIEGLRDETRTIVLYEAPHRLAKTLEELAEVLGGERELSLVRELTKRHEEVGALRGGSRPCGNSRRICAGHIRKERGRTARGRNIRFFGVYAGRTCGLVRVPGL